MSAEVCEKANFLIGQSAFSDALELLEDCITNGDGGWNEIYLAGQCYRFMGDFDSAVRNLKEAVSLKDDIPEIWLALGIAFQIQENFQEAISSLETAVTLNPDYDLAYNSLALTHKKNGDLKKASELYEEGIKALSRGIVSKLINKKENPINKHENLEPALWWEYACYGAVYLSAFDDQIQDVLFPTADMALREETNETHMGYYWENKETIDGELGRLYLPNFFNTFREILRSDRSYAQLTGNRGTVLQQLGNREDAEKHFMEAEEFLPPNG